MTKAQRDELKEWSCQKKKGKKNKAKDGFPKIKKKLRAFVASVMKKELKAGNDRPAVPKDTADLAITLVEVISLVVADQTKVKHGAKVSSVQLKWPPPKEDTPTDTMSVSQIAAVKLQKILSRKRDD